MNPLIDASLQTQQFSLIVRSLIVEVTKEEGC